MLIIRSLLAILLLALSATVTARSQVTYIKPDSPKDSRQGYFIRLLQLALNQGKTVEKSFKLQPHQVQMSQSRAIQLLKNGRELDVLWTMTSEQREKILLPVRIPLLKGLMGYRVLIIRKADRAKFDKVDSLAALKAFVAGQGHDWPDTTILRANGLKVESGSTYEGLFQMLHAKRFDYFPRSIGEAWGELSARKGEGLVLNNRIVLYYLSPVYFFVAPGDHTLARRLEAGLMTALNDGSFERLFNEHVFSDQGIDPDWLKNKTILRLKNPLLPAKTPVEDKKLWYN